MGFAIRQACASLGLAMRSVNRASVLSPEQAASGRFFSLRTVVVSVLDSAVVKFIGTFAPGGDSDDDDWFNDDEEDPLLAVCDDVFA